MGKIFPLSKKPSYYGETMALIERSFEYEKSHQFAIDFAPLVDKSNHENCFILLDENEKIIAHIGAKDRYFKIGTKTFSFTMLGGIAVDENHRGEGHFQTLLQDVMAEKISDTSFFILWSDKEKLYRKFGFYLCGSQYELENKTIDDRFLKTKYHLLSTQEKSEIHHLYENSFAKTYITIDRESKDWQLIEKITSADLYIKKNGNKITDYCFMNKGQDLPGIIYEYGSTGEIRDLIHSISGMGKVWMAKPFFETDQEQFQFFLAPGDLKKFTNFVKAFTNDHILVRAINSMKGEVYFDFNNELMGLDIPDFLRGLFGPGTFEELELPTFFISGLESI